MASPLFALLYFRAPADLVVTVGATVQIVRGTGKNVGNVGMIVACEEIEQILKKS